jgi:hypothetical protein
MNVEIGAEAALFPEKEYISGISVSVHKSYFLNVRIVRIPVYCLLARHLEECPERWQPL